MRTSTTFFLNAIKVTVSGDDSRPDHFEILSGDIELDYDKLPTSLQTIIYAQAEVELAASAVEAAQWRVAR